MAFVCDYNYTCICKSTYRVDVRVPDILQVVGDVVVTLHVGAGYLYGLRLPLEKLSRTKHSKLSRVIVLWRQMLIAHYNSSPVGKTLSQFYSLSPICFRCVLFSHAGWYNVCGWIRSSLRHVLAAEFGRRMRGGVDRLPLPPAPPPAIHNVIGGKSMVYTIV